jgi:hypothetical protein
VSELDIEDRLLYYREIRTSLRTAVRPAVDGVLAVDVLATIDRLLVGLITVDEFGPSLGADFGARAYRAIHGVDPAEPVTADQFYDLLRLPAETTLSYDQERALAAVELDYLIRRSDLLAGVLNEAAGG